MQLLNSLKEMHLDLWEKYIIRYNRQTAVTTNTEMVGVGELEKL